MGLQRVGHDWATFTFTFLLILLWRCLPSSTLIYSRSWGSVPSPVTCGQSAPTQQGCVSWGCGRVCCTSKLCLWMRMVSQGFTSLPPPVCQLQVFRKSDRTFPNFSSFSMLRKAFSPPECKNIHPSFPQIPLPFHLHYAYLFKPSGIYFIMR